MRGRPSEGRPVRRSGVANATIVAAMLTATCSVPPVAEAHPEARPAADQNQPDFGVITPSTEEAQFRGLSYAIQAFPQMTGGSGFGCGFADLDADGDADAIILGAADGRVGIFENTGAGFFVDRSLANGIPLLAQASAFAAADYDGDGLPDLYLTQVGLPNVLARNLGGFQFQDVAGMAGVDDLGAGHAPSFGDYDNDGWLDLYVCNYNGAVPGTSDLDNRLYRNLGNGAFEDVSVAQTVDDAGYGFQAVWFDYDLDGDVDLYLSNDRGHLAPFLPNQLWRNDNGQLVNVSAASGADVGLFSMGVACGDFNDDQRPDIYCTNIPGDFAWGTNNPLLIGQADGTFTEESVAAGVDNPYTSWGSIFYDFDNNGYQDLYVNNMFVANTLYLSDGSFPCVERGAAAAVTASNGPSFGSAIADVDGDGDLDLLTNNLGGNVELFINREGTNQRSIRFNVVGRGGNREAIGARVETLFGLRRRFREIMAGGNGYLGQNELTVHVGAEAWLVADEVYVSWPGGDVTRTLTNAPTNITWTIYPPARLGDANDDGAVELDDFVVLSACNGADPALGCEVMDFDGNFVIDADDYTAFLAVYTGPLTDCDDNGVFDIDQIIANRTLDKNRNGELDACEPPCPDLNGDGAVSFADLLVLIGSWGHCTSCPADIDGDGGVGFQDVLLVIGAWGPCPF